MCTAPSFKNQELAAMKNKSSNLAVISNKTLEATKVVNLNHYDISSALQTTLEFNKLIAIFSSKIESIIPHSAFVYTNAEFGQEIKKGVFSRHSCSYGLKVEDQSLGELKLMRQTKFTINELELLETLLCCLIYPLKNTILYQRAIRMAYTDPLTHTNNRASFDDLIQREMSLAIRHGKSLSVVFLDIDYFKAINDEHGHECGDITLALVAKWIKKCLRDSDIVFRYGGEEFVVLLRETNLEGAQLVAERIRKSIQNHTLSYDMSTLKVTASLGVSALHSDDTADTFVKRADTAMYQAKHNGRNQVRTAD
jgi:diguanylate cyclase (GGDEF)-like protein